MCQSIVLEKTSSFKKYLLFFLSVWMLFQVFSPTQMIAQGNLLLMPRRIVFEGAKRYEEINIANTGIDTAQYIVSFMQIRMKEDGGFQEIKQPDSGQHFADRYLRFFPRSVSLSPNEAQVEKYSSPGQMNYNRENIVLTSISGPFQKKNPWEKKMPLKIQESR
jgi:hypothetical protein